MTTPVYSLGCKKSKEDPKDYLFADFYKRAQELINKDSVHSLMADAGALSDEEKKKIELFDQVINSNLEFFKAKLNNHLLKAATSGSLKDKMPVIYDQGSLGSCTANAIAGVYEYQQCHQQLRDFMPSRLFIYYCEREMEGTINEDSGAAIRDGIISVNTKGVCNEKKCPYVISNFTQKPSDKAYTNASKHKAVIYLKVAPKVASFKSTIDLGYPIVFGFEVPNYFMSSAVATSGIMPEYNNQPIVGGHAVVCCGYDDNMTHGTTKGYILVRNSWGTSWGQDGYFWMPYTFLESGLCWDCWTIEQVSQKVKP
jgi:C1A family cysteine protease